MPNTTSSMRKRIHRADEVEVLLEPSSSILTCRDELLAEIREHGVVDGEIALDALAAGGRPADAGIAFRRESLREVFKRRRPYNMRPKRPG